MVVPLPHDAVRRAVLFGKLPAHGDFVSRGLDPAERDSLDRWLSGSVLDAQQAHGAAFADRFDRAPPWRYALRGGDGWSAGAILPSVDAAGRRFPLIAGLAGLADHEVASVPEAVEALACRMLVEQWHADTAVAVLDGLGDGPAAVPPRAGWWTLGAAADKDEDAPAFAPAHLDGERPAALARLMLTAERPTR